MEHNLIIISILLLWTLIVYGHNDNSKKIHKWNLLNFGFPTLSARQKAIADGNFLIDNCIPIDVQPYMGTQGLKVFITIPRFQSGVPYTLATVDESAEGSLLKSYPNYNWHNSHGINCDGITSAFRVAVTECNQMWVIDSGVIGSVQHCPPQLLLFDLESDELLHRYRFNGTISPQLYIPTASLFITPVVNVRDPGECRRTMVYIADVSYHGLVVYDYEQNVAWRVENKFMYPNPEYGTHYIAGEHFSLMDGIFGMSTDKYNLYFHPLASATEYSVPLKVLDNSTNWEDSFEGMPNEFKKVGFRKSQCGAEAMDSRGNLFCVTFNPIEIIYWNVKSPHASKHMRKLPSNPKLLEFVSGMKVMRNIDGEEELWLISNRFQKIAAGTQNPNETNFRILKFSLRNIENVNNIENAQNDLQNRLIFS